MKPQYSLTARRESISEGKKSNGYESPARRHRELIRTSLLTIEIAVLMRLNTRRSVTSSYTKGYAAFKDRWR